jgi:actin-related protein
MASSSENVIAVDIGQNTWRAGIAGECDPSLEIPTVVHRDQRTHITFVGEEADIVPCCCPTDMVHPIKRGKVTDWNALEKLFLHTFSNLHATPETHDMVVSESPVMTAKDRERMAELLFETFGVRGLYTSAPAIFTLLSKGAHSGLVIECGEGLSSVVPVYEGFIFPCGYTMELAGEDVAQDLSAALSARGYNSLDAHEVQNVMRESCYVADNYEAELKKAHADPSSVEQTLNLDIDGSIVTVGKERFTVPEIIFRPALHAGSTLPGISELAHRTLRELPDFVRIALRSDVILRGGCAKMPGFSERLYTELMALENNAQLSINRSQRNSAWQGASMMGGFPSFTQCVVTKDTYAEVGKKAIDNCIRTLIVTMDGNQKQTVYQDPILSSHVRHTHSFAVQETSPFLSALCQRLTP